MSNIYDRERDLLEQLNQKAAANSESFRNEARLYFENFTPSRRKLIRSLSSKSANPYDILTAWQDDLAPLLTSLERSTKNKVFQRSLSKYLHADEGLARLSAKDMIGQRKRQLESEFTQRFNGKSIEKAIRRLLSMPSSEVEAMRGQYILVKLAQKVANEHGVRLIDPHASALSRAFARAGVRRERRRGLRQENKRLLEIANRIKDIDSSDDGIVGEIIKNEIDLVLVLSARTNYEKRIAALPKEEAMDAARRLEIFYEETRGIRRKVIARISGSSEMGAEAIHDSTVSAEQLLRRIFDLQNTKKNNLLVLTKERRELCQERDDIVRAMGERLAARA